MHEFTAVDIWTTWVKDPGPVVTVPVLRRVTVVVWVTVVVFGPPLRELIANTRAPPMTNPMTKNAAVAA